jgi:hypothetical protein
VLHDNDLGVVEDFDPWLTFSVDTQKTRPRHVWFQEALVLFAQGALLIVVFQGQCLSGKNDLIAGCRELLLFGPGIGAQQEAAREQNQQGSLSHFNPQSQPVMSDTQSRGRMHVKSLTK